MRWLVLLACLLIMVCLGTAQAWSVFVKPLQQEYALSMFQAQLVFATSVCAFCGWIIVAGRFHDRLGPRMVGLAGSCLAGAAYAIAYFWGHHYLLLWLGMGLIYGMACATVYTCPIATAIKWFPERRGLVAGLAAAAFAFGPILVQAIAQTLFGRGWRPLEVLGFVGAVYTPILILCVLLLHVPVHAHHEHHQRAVSEFRPRALVADRRIWLLFVGMLCGTFPHLLVIGNIRLIAESWSVGEMVSLGLPAMALASALGRIFWGYVLDRMGTMAAMRSAQVLLILSIAGLALSAGRPGIFLVSVFGIGFSYGSNFAIYPGTVAKVYGPHLLGSIYPWIMAAQGVSSVGPMLGGALSDLTHSYMTGVLLGGGVAVVGLVATQCLKPQADSIASGEATAFG